MHRFLERPGALEEMEGGKRVAKKERRRRGTLAFMLFVRGMCVLEAVCLVLVEPEIELLIPKLFVS